MMAGYSHNMVSRLLARVGLLLLAGSAGSCISGEAECHRRAMAMLGCCPFCDENCDVSKNADAKFAEDACLADLAEQRQDVERDVTSDDDGDTTHSGDDSATTLDPFW
jgi:hypothetical protein